LIPYPPFDADPVNPVRFFMVAIVAEFIHNKKDNQEAAGYPESQSGNVDKGVSFLPQQVSQSDFKIVSNHGILFPVGERICKG
jgi:hypothetical protein